MHLSRDVLRCTMCLRTTATVMALLVMLSRLVLISGDQYPIVRSPHPLAVVLVVL